MGGVTFKATLAIFENSPLWGLHFVVPNDIALLFVKGKDRRVICLLNGHLSIHCALMPNKDIWFVMLNQTHRKQLYVPVNATLEIEMTKDESEYGMPMPDEFQEVLLQDENADRYFHALSPGKQRSLLYIVGKVKNSESRIRKSLAIADHLTANKGSIVSKLLMEALKEYNRM